MISDNKIDAAAADLAKIFRRMIGEGADMYAMQRAIVQALWMIGRDKSALYASGVAAQLAARMGEFIARLKGTGP